MENIQITDAEQLENIKKLHPELRKAAAAVIRWAWDSDIDFKMSANEIHISLSPLLGDKETSTNPIVVHYRPIENS